MTRSGVWILLVSLTAPAAAQETGPFTRLAQTIEPGDDVKVTLLGGRVWKAQVVTVTHETLSVLVRGTQLDLGEDDIWVVRQQTGDSTRNGALIGFAAGAACVVWAVESLCASEGDCARDGVHYTSYALSAGLSGLLGLWIGVGVDSLVKSGETVVWQRRPQTRWSVTPLLAPDRGGVAVSLSF